MPRIYISKAPAKMMSFRIPRELEHLLQRELKLRGSTRTRIIVAALDHYFTARKRKG